MRNQVTGCVLAVALCVLAGCGGTKATQPQAYPVQGEVFRSGKPAKGGTIQFVSQADPNTQAVGEIGPDGKFKLSTFTGNESRSGAVPGDYKAILVFSASDPVSNPKKVFKVEPRENTFKVEVP